MKLVIGTGFCMDIYRKKEFKLVSAFQVIPQPQGVTKFQKKKKIKIVAHGKHNRAKVSHWLNVL